MPIINKNLQKLLQVALLSASAAAVPGQNYSPAPVSDEIRATSPPKPAGPKRSLAAPVWPTESRAFAFAGRHPFGSERTSQPLIIQTSKFDAKVADQIREDMAVMSRILDKSCSEFTDEPEKVLGLDIFIHGGRASRNMFIDDYGVIFTVNVDLPLKSAPKGAEADEKGETQVNAEWEDARNELFGAKRSSGVRFVHQDQRREFNPQDVTRLRENLLDGLRNAANIRNLNDENWVTLVVRGRGGVSESAPESNAAETDENESTMVLKVRKSFIDAFAKKGLSAEEFRKKVAVTIY